MTPGSLVQTIQDVLKIWQASEAPHDYVLRTYYKSHRFLGSGDRRALSETLFALMRVLSLLDWWIEHLNLQTQDRERWRVILYLLLEGGHSLTSLEALFNGNRYHSSPLTSQEQAVIETFLEQKGHSATAPVWIKANCPEWLYEKMQESLGEHTDDELITLNSSAPLDLRVNTLKCIREHVMNYFKAECITAEPTPFSPHGVRLPRGTSITQSEPYLKGWIEIQDEGSQLAAILVDAKPGHTVLDCCAGGGGKALAIAAAMNNQGRLIAADIARLRLREAEKRFTRAGVANATCQLLPLQSKDRGKFDRVLVDAPCSGSGTWRRSPDLKFRLTPERLEELQTIQSAILNEAAEYVAMGGRLIYVTCSLLRDENEYCIERFLATHSDFSIVPYGDIWRSLMSVPPPTPENFLRLTPAQHQTDGFFVAVLGRSG